MLELDKPVNKGGRPTLPPEQRRSERWWTRLTPAERELCARAAGPEAAEWTRRVLLAAAAAEAEPAGANAA